MPMIHVEWLAGRSREQKRELTEVFTRELSRIVNCKVDDVQIVFSDVERANWAVGGVFSDNPEK